MNRPRQLTDFPSGRELADRLAGNPHMCRCGHGSINHYFNADPSVIGVGSCTKCGCLRFGTIEPKPPTHVRLSDGKGGP